MFSSFSTWTFTISRLSPVSGTFPNAVDRWLEDLPISFNEHVHCWQIHLIHLYHPQLFELSTLHSVLDFFWDFTPEISQTSKCRNDEIIVFGRETPCHIGAVKWHKIRSIRPLYIKLNIHVFNIFKTGFNVIKILVSCKHVGVSEWVYGLNMCRAILEYVVSFASSICTIYFNFPVPACCSKK